MNIIWPRRREKAGKEKDRKKWREEKWRQRFSNDNEEDTMVYAVSEASTSAYYRTATIPQ